MIFLENVEGEGRALEARCRRASLNAEGEVNGSAGLALRVLPLEATIEFDQSLAVGSVRAHAARRCARAASCPRAARRIFVSTTASGARHHAVPGARISTQRRGSIGFDDVDGEGVPPSLTSRSTLAREIVLRRRQRLPPLSDKRRGTVCVTRRNRGPFPTRRSAANTWPSRRHPGRLVRRRDLRQDQRRGLRLRVERGLHDPSRAERNNAERGVSMRPAGLSRLEGRRIRSSPCRGRRLREEARRDA